MPRYQVTSPDGRTVVLEGDSAPTDADLEEVFKGLPRSVSVRMTRGPAGVQVALTGRGAAEAAQSVRERLRAAGKASVGVVWRESDV